MAGLAPQLLIMEWETGIGVLEAGARVGIIAAIGTALAGILRLRRHRFLLRSLAVGSRAVDPRELESLAGAPRGLTYRYFLINALLAASVLVPALRPEKLDEGRAVSLFVLAVTILAASSVPLYVLLRESTLRVIETAPLEPLTQLLEADELDPAPRRRIVTRMVIAVALPITLVGGGGVLVAHAHLRAFLEESRKDTALALARTSLEPGSFGLGQSGRADAIAAAAELGFLARIDRTQKPTEETVTREADGQISVAVPVEDGLAEVRFSANLDRDLTTLGALVALVAVGLAAALGTLFGRALGDDLVMATRGVRMLGTENVMRGVPEIASLARFELVSRMGRAIEVLAERFRVFAAAQERALEARENARRMRGLLFASVSHDLKSPLNAILGFAELVGREDLSDAQRESLQLIVNRGRELLAIIETILDAARVEAGQLSLFHRAALVEELVTESVRKAHELAADAPTEVVVEVARGLPLAPVDPGYVTRAFGVIIAHALRTAPGEPGGRPVRVRAHLQAGTAESGVVSDNPIDQIRFDVEYASRAVPPAELTELFARQATSRGRGLTLGLSLARSVIELHGGTLEVDGAPDGVPVVHCWLPLVVSGPDPRRRQLPSVPMIAYQTR
jgi:signal transduction histidine kinase